MRYYAIIYGNDCVDTLDIIKADSKEAALDIATERAIALTGLFAYVSSEGDTLADVEDK